MTDRLTEVSALLLKQYLFQGLNVEQIKQIAQNFRYVRYQADQTVIYNDMPGTNFYIVFKGFVEVSTVVKKPFRQARTIKLFTYGPGNYFGEEALLYKRNNKDIVKTREETRLLVLDQVSFENLLKNYPEIKKKLTLTCESRMIARNEQFPWLANGEAIHLLGKKHYFFLFRALIIPIFLFVLSIPLILYTITQLGQSTVSTLFQIGSILLLLGSIVWAIWNWIDWGNDYFVVTSQRILWHEKVVGLYDNRNEAPLYTILTVGVKSSQFGRILGYGSVTTRTYTGNIDMINIARPDELSAYIEGHIKRLLQLTQDEEMSQIEKDVKKALGREDPTAPELSELVIEQPDTKEEKKIPKKLSLNEQIQHFLKVRYEQDGEITYRKHWFLLFQKLWLPITLIILLILASTLLFPNWFDSSDSSSLINIIVLGTIVGFIILVSWMIYSYVDWRNDIYKLTPEQIFQIYRKPLGTEVKKSASIENILTIVHERENLIGIMLNFGVVTVSVGDTEIVFEGVFNPDKVHQDIANFQEALKRRKTEESAIQERKRMVKWLTTYNKEAEKKKNLQTPPESGQISG